MSAADGILLVDKPAGITSHDAVARVRRALGTRKVGHAGTLDPAATGLLILGVGAGTRLLTFLVGLDKCYEATIRLGIATSTDDADGEVTARAGCPADVDAEAALSGFRGVQQQRPAAVSAVKVGGVPAYRRARAGESVELPAREVTVWDLDLHRSRSTVADGTSVLDLDLGLKVSSGTYVRSIARDLGARLGTGAHLTALRRTAVGPFRVEEVGPVPDGRAEPGDVPELQPLGAVAAEVLPTALVPPEDVGRVRNGTRLPCPPSAVGFDVAGPGSGAAPPGPATALLTRDRELLAVACCAGGRWEYRFVVPG